MNGIPFPKMHIAESVLNRIQNALDEDGSFSITTPDMQMPPITPDPVSQGQLIEEETEITPEPAAPEPGLEDQTEQGMLSESLQGGSPFDGALIGALG